MRTHLRLEYCEWADLTETGSNVHRSGKARLGVSRFSFILPKKTWSGSKVHIRAIRFQIAV